MTDTTATGDQAKERFAAIMRYPRKAALISGALVPITAAVNLFALKDMSWPLLGVTVISALVCILALWNVANFSPAAVARLEALSPQVDGKFSLWKPGTGGYEGMPFAHGLDFQRFGMLSYALHGAPVEIGHLASQLTARFRAPTGRRHAYVVVRLPERLPHMIVSFGIFLGCWACAWRRSSGTVRSAWMWAEGASSVFTSLMAASSSPERSSARRWCRCSSVSGGTTTSR